MIRKWLNKRKFDRLSKSTDLMDGLELQALIPKYRGIPPSTHRMDFIPMRTRCGDVSRLIDGLSKTLLYISKLENIPSNLFGSPQEGVVGLTTYCTNTEGYPYPISIADEELRDILKELNEALDNVKSTDDAQHSYYVRKVTSFANEAIQFRLTIKELN